MPRRLTFTIDDGALGRRGIVESPHQLPGLAVRDLREVLADRSRVAGISLAPIRVEERDPAIDREPAKPAIPGARVATRGQETPARRGQAVPRRDGLVACGGSSLRQLRQPDRIEIDERVEDRQFLRTQRFVVVGLVAGDDARASNSQLDECRNNLRCPGAADDDVLVRERRDPEGGDDGDVGEALPPHLRVVVRCRQHADPATARGQHRLRTTPGAEENDPHLLLRSGDPNQRETLDVVFIVRELPGREPR